ncbi:CRISPR-associated endonuclease Cas3'' [Chlorobaculum sp. MV4-Y]|uniref:CRISPR-associated endonuclease Cas3'' n=1 Tax=Chlorobaculum sp. MV4-Y TaxID=2976335 RepID=UPI0021AF2B53|nr:CRISPR-associated endonuclease Cas3'' [Chlorobaculum sp. MV4-Y]UWX58582.1 CRISPR-associated endonuclease Cas3'' [Chlorobaculum sp. MV4-Y]
MSDEKIPAAHLRKDESGRWLEHELSDHLSSVAKIASNFASEFGNADWARAAGMLHDLGKFNPRWQEYLRKSNGDYLEEHDGQD